jgi:hypothetical protein
VKNDAALVSVGAAKLPGSSGASAVSGLTSSSAAGVMQPANANNMAKARDLLFRILNMAFP